MWLHFAVVPCMLAAIAVVTLLRMADVESGPITEDEGTAMLIASLGALLITAAVLTLVGVLAVKLLRGRRWARTATLVFNSVWIALGFIALIAPLDFVQPILAVGYEGAIAVCLCTPSAKAWFANPDAPSEDAPGAGWTAGKK
ncbi:hypothetical protein [Glycomyces albidus]|uniref:DUF2569 family protein n=1 Tax=Glycomyces albidus TaxID=2656774 RepID=A0A6L5G3A6_9ACTN|nr:hypothetical protein [Glycomyces albidus]MQM24377.1 hypothetical protein [Glycomyces albidus]